MRPRLALPLLLSLAMINPPAASQAEVIICEFTSTITYTQNLPVGGLAPSVGAPVRGYFAYDTAAPDLAPLDPTTGNYSTGHLVLIIDNHRVACDLAAAYVYDINAPNDLFGISAGAPLGTSPLIVDGNTVTTTYVALNFSEFSGSLLTSDALPTAAQLSQLPIDQFNMVQTNTVGVLLYDNVTITSVRAGDVVISSVVDVGNDQGRQVRLTWSRSSFEGPLSLRPITQYAIFRRIDPLPKLPVGSWDFLSTVPALGEATYHAVVPTLCDSTAAGDCNSVYVVRAMTVSPTVFFDSPVRAGSSIDNQAPSIPQHLASHSSGMLTWDESPDPDFNYYTIYGSSGPQWSPGASVLGHATAPLFNAAGQNFAYVHVTATDFAGNQGAPATILNATVVAAPAANSMRFALSAIWPNPAQGMTSVSYELPHTGGVEAAVFDLHGRRVRALGTFQRSAGRNLLSWDGRDDAGRDVASGVYVVRVRFEGTEVAGRVLRSAHR